MLDAAEEALNEVAILVKMLIEGPLDETITSRRYHGLDVVDGEVFEDPVGVVGLIGADGVGLQVL